MSPTHEAFEDLHDFDDGTLPEVEVYVAVFVYGFEKIVEEW